MSVILEFTVEKEAFEFGQMLAPPPEMHIEIERVVPTGSRVVPFIWVTGEDVDAFETDVEAKPAVAHLQRLDTIDSHVLYRIEWRTTPTDLIKAIADVDAVILEAGGQDSWVFRLRFPDHADLSRFHDYVREQQIPLDIHRTYRMTETTDPGYLFDLTAAQRQAILLALREGYFASPKEVSLQELAADLDITRQALSKRIRKANETILREVLGTSPTGLD